MNATVKMTARRLEDCVSTHMGVTSVPARKASEEVANRAKVITCLKMLL